MISFVRGDTFTARVTHTPVEGSLQTMEELTISSQIKTSDDVRHPVIISMNPNFMSFSVTCADTQFWSLGDAEWDLKVIYQGRIAHTKSIKFKVLKQITL